MKKRLLPLAAMALMLLMLFSACSKGEKSTDTDAAVNDTTVSATEEVKEETHNVFGKFETVTVDGKKIDQTVFEGKITVVNIWTTYSVPCKEQMAVFEKISKEYADKNINVIGIASDVKKEADGKYNPDLLADAQEIIEDESITYTNILPCDELNEAKLSSMKYVPETVILDEKGNIIGDSYEGTMSYDEWCRAVDGALK